MQLIVHSTSRLNGTVAIPGSKSQSIRALVLGTLARGKSQIGNLLRCEDTDNAMDACRGLGATVSLNGTEAIIDGPGLPLIASSPQIFTGNSGITTRFILPALGLRAEGAAPVTLDCGPQMRARPIQPLVESLRQLGMVIEYSGEKGMLPLTISGPLHGGTAEVDGLTSQYTSALLLSLPCTLKDSTIIIRNLHERPYVEMTLEWLRKLGIQFRHDRYDQADIFHIPGRQQYAPFSTTISGDFSSASTLIAAACLIPGTVQLNGLEMTDPQGDKRLIDILQEMGASIKVTSHALTIEGGRRLNAMPIDANDIPDLLPALSVVAAFAHGETVIRNVAQARIKETDRIHSMADGLTRMGAEVISQADGLIIRGGKPLHGASLDGYGDHRTVMALSVAGMMATGETSISTAEAIDKTFPEFVSLMTTLGAALEVRHDD